MKMILYSYCVHCSQKQRVYFQLEYVVMKSMQQRAKATYFAGSCWTKLPDQEMPGSLCLSQTAKIQLHSGHNIYMLIYTINAMRLGFLIKELIIW